MESALSMLGRIRGTLTLPDPSTTNDSVKVFVVEQDICDLLATRMFVYSMVRTALRHTPPNTHCPSDCARVLIFDGQCWFKENDFINHFEFEDKTLEQTKLFRAGDAAILLMHLYDQLKVNFAINLNLHLVVISVNSSILYPELLNEINRFLFSLSITVKVVLIVDRLKKDQLEFYRQKSICDIINCKIVPPENETTKNNCVTLKIAGMRNSTINEKSIYLNK